MRGRVSGKRRCGNCGENGIKKRTPNGVLFW